MDYSILRYGAVADGVTNCAAAIQQAVDVAAAAGGGRVIVPAGRFLSGSVLLKDNVELHLESGAVQVKELISHELRRGAYQQPEPRRYYPVPAGRGRHRP